MDQTSLKAVVLGASGATGRVLVNELCGSSKWSEVAVIARRLLPQWEQIPGKEKIKIIQVASLDELEDIEKWKQFEGYSSFFCCLGARTKEGDAQFYKVDFTYCLYGGKIAVANNIPHYSIVTSQGSDKSSMFLYTRTKGQIEEALANLKFPYLSILRPGAILNRENDSRVVESILKYTPFIPKIENRDLAKAMRINAEQLHTQPQTQPTVNIYTNPQLLSIVTSSNAFK